MAIITMLTDFGSRDPYVAIMKGMILGNDPGARMVDLTHDVAAGEPVLLFGSSSYLKIAVNRGNAADISGVRRGDEVRLSFPDRAGMASRGR